MAELFWEEKEGVLTARLVVAGQLSEQQIENVGRELLELLDKTEGQILLDLQDVEFISSALLAKLISLHNKCKDSQTELRICSVPRLVMKVIRIARLDAVLNICDSVDETPRAD